MFAKNWNKWSQTNPDFCLLKYTFGLSDLFVHITKWYCFLSRRNSDTLPEYVRIYCTRPLCVDVGKRTCHPPPTVGCVSGFYWIADPRRLSINRFVASHIEQYNVVANKYTICIVRRLLLETWRGKFLTHATFRWHYHLAGYALRERGTITMNWKWANIASFPKRISILVQGRQQVLAIWKISWKLFPKTNISLAIP
jgi:hypothetical protein